MKKLFILWGLLFSILSLSVFCLQTGCTPNGTPYNPFPRTATPTVTPTPCGCFIMYANGGFVSIGNVYTWSGGGSSSPTGNATDTAAGAACCGHTQSFQAIYTTLAGGGWSGLSVTPQTSPFNMSAYTTCTFYAKANETATVGFNAAEPSADTNSVAESLTTSWKPITITITDGSRSDGFANSSPPGTSISQTTNYFVEVITTTPATPVTVNFDQVSFQ